MNIKISFCSLDLFARPLMYTLPMQYYLLSVIFYYYYYSLLVRSLIGRDLKRDLKRTHYTRLQEEGFYAVLLSPLLEQF